MSQWPWEAMGAVSGWVELFVPHYPCSRHGIRA